MKNGIWLCQNCAKLVDNDGTRYTAALLRRWKTLAEDHALRSIEANSSAQGASDSSGDNETKLILVIDDDAQFLYGVLSFLRKTFRASGFASADDGLAFLLANAKEISLVILDMMMPVPAGASSAVTADGIFSGLWVLEQAQPVLKKHRVPVIVFSAALQSAIASRVRRINSQTHAGLVTLLYKPVPPKILVSEIKHNLHLWNK